MKVALELYGEDVSVQFGVVGPALQFDVAPERLWDLLKKARVLEVLRGPVFQRLVRALVRLGEARHELKDPLRVRREADVLKVGSNHSAMLEDDGADGADELEVRGLGRQVLKPSKSWMAYSSARLRGDVPRRAGLAPSLARA